ncbi:MAG: ROK family protein [Candidatus Aenigmarchaeota archaeon]|nr:ROK family protein [Candidatus Aenigmarchaeota archaeon]
MPYRIGIDIGGTKVLGVILNNGKILRKKKIQISRKNPSDFMDSVDKLIDYLLDGKPSMGSAIGLAFPGDIEKGKLLKAPNLHYLEGFDFSGFLRGQKFKKISFANDDACFALGEAIRLNRKNLVGITIGTGFGSGVVVGGKIYCGQSNSVELGHTIVRPGGRLCHCKNRGCLEEYISTRALLRETKKVFGKEVDAYELNVLSRKGNKKATEVCKTLGFYLGIGLGNISNILNPEVISVGGGLAKNRLIVKYGIEEMRKILYSHEPKVVFGKYESNAIGAASL